MNNKQLKRRQIVKYLLFGSVGASTALLTKYEAFASESHALKKNQAFLCWQQNFSGCPESYLSSLGINALNSKEIHKNEFKNNHIVAFQGIYIAKSELAALALIEQAQEF